jgi:NDP-sugar pyrophosphorylase family protein
MQIVIPMSGFGQRFIDAGYKDPKPLIEIDGKPIIEHVVNLFPGEENFLFICNSDHLANTNMREILKRIAPQGKIFEIAPHKKGPVYAVSQIFDEIDNEQEIIVNYCDFSTYWDYPDFLKHTRDRKADGAIPSYKGYHPHMLGTTNYAFMRDKEQWMLEIKEKEPFTNNRMQEYASNGTYYFKSGGIVKKYFNALMDQDINLKGEYYVSLIYNLLVKDNLKVSIYEIQHMLQWGTPADVEEYNMWSNLFRRLTENTPPLKTDANLLIPMAGLGSRFTKDGYTTPKPLIEVSGKYMVEQAMNSLVQTNKKYLIAQREHEKEYHFSDALKDCNIIQIDGLTEGQAITTEFGVKELDKSPIFIGACDNGMLYDAKKLDSILKTEPDIMAFTFINYPGANARPEMYGWVATDSENNISAVSVKKAISDSPERDHGIVGAFYFKNPQTYEQCLKYLKDNEIRVNGEFYIDSMLEAGIKLGLKLKAFPIDYYLCWGTPNDLKTFQYWQSFFHKCSWHPYTIEKDCMMDQSKSTDYIKCFNAHQQEHR